MVWKLEIDPEARKELDDLDPPVARRLLKFLFERVARLEDPRSIGQALRGLRFGDLWKYRVGDYRIIAKIEDNRLCIVVVRVGNRRDVYRER